MTLPAKISPLSTNDRRYVYKPHAYLLGFGIMSFSCGIYIFLRISLLDAYWVPSSLTQLCKVLTFVINLCGKGEVRLSRDVTFIRRHAANQWSKNRFLGYIVGLNSTVL